MDWVLASIPSYLLIADLFFRLYIFRDPLLHRNTCGELSAGFLIKLKGRPQAKRPKFLPAPDSMSSLLVTDPEVAAIIAAENRRQHHKIRLIASENYVSQAVLEATGSILTNIYYEGYPGDRCYEGQWHIDRLERLCIERVK